MERGELRVEHFVARLDDESAAVRDRVARVQREVHHNLLDLTRVGVRARERGLELRLELHLLADQAREDRVHAVHDVVQIEHRGLQHLFTAEREQLPDQLPRAFCGGEHLLDVCPQLRCLLAGRAEREAAVADDRREQVVEVVCDAARKPSDRLQLL